VCGGWYKTDTNGEVFYLVEDETERKLEKLYHEQVVVKEPKKEQKWGDIVRESVKWCKEHREESVEDYLKPQGPQGPVGPGPGPKGVIVGYEPTPQTPDKIEKNLREAFKKVQQTEEWKETQRKIDSNYEELVEKDNPKPMDEVVDRLVKKYQAQKLWNRVRDELGYSIDLCDEIVDLVEDWILDEQSSAGSQNVDVEFLVDGFNDAIRKMKEMLR
jgi:hypothetical protein